MQNKFYTNVQCVGNNILYRGVIDGKRVKAKIPYKPSLYEIAKTETPYRTLKGEFLREIQFETIRDAKDYLRQFDDVSGKTIYGNNRFEYVYIGEEHRGPVEWDLDHVSVAVFDIEVGSENGFPEPSLANEPITAITISYLNGHTFVFGCGDYEVQGDERYMKCVDEYHLLKYFLKLWVDKCPDAISGWNTKFFDIPYIVNRMRKVLGEDETKKLSPWNMIRERQIKVNNDMQTVYDIVGVGDFDYLELYKWYSPDGKSQDSYKLDNIAHQELNERKLSYDDYDNLHDLYKRNFQRFIEYNIKDVKLIFRLDEKLKLFELGLTLAYDTKTNYNDVFAQTRMWDALTYNKLNSQNIIVPPREIQDKDEAFEGAYVKVPQVGLHEFVASFDLDSLYPHLMMQYNISPETLVEPEDYTGEMRSIISSGVSVDKMLERQVDTSLLSKNKVTLTPNGQFFRTDIQGFLPKMMEEMYEDRKKFKKMMLQAKQEYEDETDANKKFEISKRVARYNNLQLAKKVSLNSAYGALGSQYFRFYDLRMALAVTTAGKLSIRWIENKLNAYLNKVLKTDSDYVIASDTDSIYLRLNELILSILGENAKKDIWKTIDLMDKICEQKIRPYIDKSYAELAEYVGAYAQKMRMKREALADRGIWTAKKRYILHVYDNEGVRYHEPVMKVMGLEMIKSSTPGAIREKLNDALPILMKSTESAMQDFIAEFREQIRTLPVEDISFPRGVNNLEEYTDKNHIYRKGTPLNVKSSLLYNHYLKEYGLDKKYPLIKSGEKIKYVYLKQPNTIKDIAIAFPGRLPPEFKLDDYIDYEVQFEKAFLDPLKVILDCVGWSHQRVASLFD